MQICGVVVLFNPTINNLESIKSYSSLLDFLIIIDNTESFENSKIFFDSVPNSEYVSLGENKGLGYALNLGCKLAKEKGFDYALTMDQDSVLPQEGFREYSESILKIKDAALISPQYIIDRKKDITLCDKISEIYWTMQSACIFNLNILHYLGYFKEDYFIDVIDYEYCLRAREKKFKILINYNYAIKHTPAVTRYSKLLKIGYGYCSPSRIYYQSRNLRAVSKRYGCIKAKFLLMVKYLKIMLLFDNKKEFLKMWKRGKKDFKNNVFGKLEV